MGREIKARGPPATLRKGLLAMSTRMIAIAALVIAVILLLFLFAR
jgi:hypothetical protein